MLLCKLNSFPTEEECLVLEIFLMLCKLMEMVGVYCGIVQADATGYSKISRLLSPPILHSLLLGFLVGFAELVHASVNIYNR